MKILPLAALLVALSVGCSARADVIYSETFQTPKGGSTALAGTRCDKTDVPNKTWLASDAIKRSNGTTDAGKIERNEDAKSAYLPVDLHGVESVTVSATMTYTSPGGGPILALFLWGGEPNAQLVLFDQASICLHETGITMSGFSCDGIDWNAGTPVKLALTYDVKKHTLAAFVNGAAQGTPAPATDKVLTAATDLIYAGFGAYNNTGGTIDHFEVSITKAH